MRKRQDLLNRPRAFVLRKLPPRRSLVCYFVGQPAMRDSFVRDRHGVGLGGVR